MAALVSLATSILVALALLLGFEGDINLDYGFSIAAEGLDGQLIILLLAPFLTYIATYIGVALFCALFNLLSPYTGGITLDVREPD